MKRTFKPITSQWMQVALRRIAERHGYTATRGPHPGAGSPSALIQALDAGELATVLLDSDERWRLILWLEKQATQHDGLEDAIKSLAMQLRMAAEREVEREKESND